MENKYLESLKNELSHIDLVEQVEGYVVSTYQNAYEFYDFDEEERDLVLESLRNELDRLNIDIDVENNFKFSRKLEEHELDDLIMIIDDQDLYNIQDKNEELEAKIKETEKEVDELEDIFKNYVECEFGSDYELKCSNISISTYFIYEATIENVRKVISYDDGENYYQEIAEENGICENSTDEEIKDFMEEFFIKEVKFRISNHEVGGNFNFGELEAIRYDDELVSIVF